MLSYGEKLLRGFVTKCFPKQKRLLNYRGAGIINPNTSQPLEIDVYFPNIKLGFEFHGRQHLTDESQRNRDKIKRKQCKEKGIVLIEIYTSNLEDDLYNKIKEKCDEHNIKITKPTNTYIHEFNILAHNYKNNIYKMNKKIKSKTFVKRRSE